VTIQDQILELIQTLVHEEGMALILISHDLGVISENTDSILVMYGGSAVETGKTDRIFDELVHPYTQGLFAAMPKLGRARTSRLVTIPGTVPDLVSLPQGCTFTDRCPLATDVCRNTPPPIHAIEPHHKVACHHLIEARSRKTEELYS
jgi:peptide/nickel transport system ATP-binding protein